ncbi:uncharacterized protein LOC117218952, partial [Megalopta genalis]|uniref:uncharacterized protein LOC117218952 n=1 Tax=Megalopta genalis TaxID=115081 RepID=UPI003FD54CA5
SRYLDNRFNGANYSQRTARANNDNGCFDFDFDFDFVLDLDGCGRYVDKAKPMLGYSLEGRICSGLKEFVCDPNSRYSKRFPCVKKWLDRTDAFLGKDATAGEETIERATEYPAEAGPARRFANNGAANSGADKMCHRGLRAIVADRNDSKNIEVRRYIDEKDYWLPRSCANGGSAERPKGTDRSSDLEVEVDSCSERIVERRAASSLRRNETNDGRSAREKRFSERGRGLESDARDWESPRAAKTRDHARRTIGRACSKLKLLIYRATREDGSTAPTPAKVTSVSVPCRPGRLIVRIFEAVPSLSECCLVPTRRKFENGIRNACSRLNGILKKLEDAEAKEPRLVCEIRSGFIDLTLRRSRTSKPRLFLARLPIRRSHPKGESRRERTREGNSGSRRGDLVRRGNSDASVDGCFGAFRGSSSPRDSTNATIRAERELPGERTNFLWIGKPEKEVSFCFANPRRASPAGTNDERCCKSDATDSDRVTLPFCDENVREANDSQESIDTEAEYVSDTETAEKSAESRDSESPSSSDSSRKVEQTVSREERANVRGLRQRLCRDPREKDDGPRSVLGASGFGSRSSEKGASNSAMESKTEIRRVGNSVVRMEKGNSATAPSAPTKKGAAPVTKRSAEIAEKFNADSVRSSNSNRAEPRRGSKCSCCGEDLSDAERIDFGSVRVTVSIESKTSSSKTEISIRDVADVASDRSESRSAPPILETTGNAVDRAREMFGRSSASRPTIPRTWSIRDRSSGTIASSNEKAIHEADRETVGRTNVEERPRRSNVSDPDGLPENDFRERTSRPGSPRRRSSPRSKSGRTIRSTRHAIRDSRSAQDLRPKSRRRARNCSDRVCRNRFCSFPAASLDRLKYLIRKKLRGLLLEERNKGTRASKTFLKNERYLVSASSGKLNEERAIRDTRSSSVRDGQRVRDRPEPGPGQAGETGGSDVSGRKKATLDGAVGERRRRTTRRGVFERIEVADIPRVFGPKRKWKFVGASDRTDGDSTYSRLFEGREDRGEDFVILYDDYERYANDICADFRLKLLQYVALCKSAKDALSKRFRSDARAVGSNSS